MAFPALAMLLGRLAGAGASGAMSGAQAAKSFAGAREGAKLFAQQLRAFNTPGPSKPPIAKRNRLNVLELADEGSPGGGEGAGRLRLAGQVAGFSAALVGARAAVTYFARAQMESAESLAKFHGGIARSVLALKRQELALQYRTAEATAGSTETLGESLQALNESMQPLKELGTNLLNTWAAGMATIVTAINNGVNTVVTPINQVIRKLWGTSEKRLPVERFFTYLGKGDFTSQQASTQQNTSRGWSGDWQAWFESRQALRRQYNGKNHRPEDPASKDS